MILSLIGIIGIIASVYIGNNYDAKKGWLVFLISVSVFFVSIRIGHPSTGGSTVERYSGYSDTYKSNQEYRKNVKEMSKIYGISEREVDAKINAVAGGR